MVVGTPPWRTDGFGAYSLITSNTRLGPVTGGANSSGQNPPHCRATLSSLREKQRPGSIVGLSMAKRPAGSQSNLLF